MLSSSQATYKKPLFLSVALHAILLTILLVDISLHHNPAVFAKGDQKVELIQAVAIDQEKLTMAKAKAAQQQAVAEQQQHELEEQQQLEMQRQLELKAQQQAELKAEAVKQQAKLAAAAKAEQQAELKAAAKARQQAELKAAAAKQQAKLEAVAKAEQQAKLKAAQALHQAKLKAAAEAQRQAKLKAIAQAQQKAAIAKRKALAAAAAEEAKLQQELATKEQQAAEVQGEVNKYQALIRHAISQQWIMPPHVDKSLTCKFQIKLAPGGVVLNVTLLRSSGDPVLDRSAQTAIYKASPLPVPSDKDAFDVFRSFVLNVKPEEALADS